MNVKQLEQVRAKIQEIRDELQTDKMGIGSIQRAVGELLNVVTRELREEVWKEYLHKEEST